MLAEYSRIVMFTPVAATPNATVVPVTSSFVAGLAVPMPTLPLLVAKLAPVVLDNAPVTASPVEVRVATLLPPAPSANVPLGPSTINSPEFIKKEPYGPDAPNRSVTAAVPESYKNELSFPIIKPEVAVTEPVVLNPPVTANPAEDTVVIGVLFTRVCTGLAAPVLP